jgi:hypothetical protein
LEIESYATRQETLDAALAKKLLTTEEYLALEANLQRDHAQRMSEIDVWRYGTGVAKAQEFFGGMADAMASGNERMQAVSKKFAAIEALINAWRAYSQTLADPSLPMIAKIPAALSILSAGMGAVNAIKGGGSGGGGGGGGAAAPAQPAASSAGTYMNFSFQGGLTSAEAMGRFMVDSINTAIENGAVIKGASIQ